VSRATPDARRIHQKLDLRLCRVPEVRESQIRWNTHLSRDGQVVFRNLAVVCQAFASQGRIRKNLLEND
jgi:hypothetical protein